MSWIARLVPRRVVFSRPAQNASERWEERQALQSQTKAALAASLNLSARL